MQARTAVINETDRTQNALDKLQKAFAAVKNCLQTAES